MKVVPNSTGPAADAIVERFLTTAFEGGRHARRVEQISTYDVGG